ncbi:hypothetical protein PTTW11_05342 [Pyrenophora teres f. teres]|uniref:Uncharacterized protein n=1 Tax=Pyrenophora teres f. teres TaxID=97479 RepID=A0A6S6W1I3_9PLEO|nr:hypothetical protein PTTW11_05342 [Pyrenophora teres f. teres]
MAGNVSNQDTISQPTVALIYIVQTTRQQQDEIRQLRQQLRTALVETNKLKAENREQRSQILHANRSLDECKE